MASNLSFGVVGAGAMGNGIAQVAAQAGMEVVLFDVADAALEKAKAVIQKSLSKLEQKGKLSGSAASIFSNIKATKQLEDFKACQFVVEAATENREIKFKIFRNLDEICSQDAVLCSNTSSISITELAAQTRRPEKVAGMHFFNPVPIMNLVEGIRGLATSEETFDRMREVTTALGKEFVQAKDSPGFVVNRILMPLINEAFFALGEGLATAEDIDKAMKLGCNFPMGPLQLADFVGIDVCLSVCEVLYRDMGDQKFSPAPLMRKYVEAGWMGRKTGRGVYVY